MVEHKVRNAFNNNYYSVYRADEVGDDKPDDVNPDIRLWDNHLAMHADFFIHAFFVFYFANFAHIVEFSNLNDFQVFKYLSSHIIFLFIFFWLKNS